MSTYVRSYLLLSVGLSLATVLYHKSLLWVNIITMEDTGKKRWRDEHTPKGWNLKCKSFFMSQCALSTSASTERDNQSPSNVICLNNVTSHLEFNSVKSYRNASYSLFVLRKVWELLRNLLFHSTLHFLCLIFQLESWGCYSDGGEINVLFLWVTEASWLFFLHLHIFQISFFFYYYFSLYSSFVGNYNI